MNVGDIPLPLGTPPARGKMPPPPGLEPMPTSEPTPQPQPEPRREPTPPPRRDPMLPRQPSPQRPSTPPHQPSPQRQTMPPRPPSPQRQFTPPHPPSPQRQVTLPRPQPSLQRQTTPPRQPSPQRRTTPPRQPSPQREPTPPPGNTMPQRDNSPGESDPSPPSEREPEDGDSQQEEGGDPVNQGEVVVTMMMTPHHLRVMAAMMGTLSNPRTAGTPVARMMTQSPRKSAVTEGWEQVAHQRGRMTTIPETNRHNYPPHLPRSQGRSWFPRRHRRDAEVESRKTHEGSSQWSCRPMHSTLAHV